MLTELYGKGGRVCQPAREGTLHCPLIVRPTSEDVVTGHLALALQVLNPRWWLSDLLNVALGNNRFLRQYYRQFRAEPWRNRPPYPRALLPWDEGSTQVDLTLTWENPPTTVYIEAKYNSTLAAKTAGDDGSSGFPSDQVIRNIRVGLLECGWMPQGLMFPQVPRDFILIVVGPTSGHRLVRNYRDTSKLRAAIPHSRKLAALPTFPCVGELSYANIIEVLARQRQRFTRPECVFADRLIDYLRHKRTRASREHSSRQLNFDE